MRPGTQWKAIGTGLLILATCLLFAGNRTAGAIAVLMGLCGLILFVIGRFYD